MVNRKRYRNTRIAPKPVQEEAKERDERSIGEDCSFIFCFFLNKCTTQYVCLCNTYI